MKQARTKTATHPTADAHIAERLSPKLAAVLAIVFGAFLMFGAAFAQPAAIHNAAHDGRHSFAFPCH